MLLAIDVGNTQTVVGVYEGESLACMWRIATNKRHTADDIRSKLVPLLQSEQLDSACIDASALASVVPQLTRAWTVALEELAQVAPVICTPENAQGLFKAKYPNLREIGADRVADAVAAQALYGVPVVVVDFGTATNIEVIDKDGCFVGGIIAPGVETSSQALFSNATRLAAIDLVAPPNAIGTSTEEAIQSGIVLGEAGRVDGLVRRVFAQLGYEAHVVATGGLASLVAQHSETIDEVNAQLTLEGLRLIANGSCMRS